jgi:hypothetical protein
MPETFEPPIIIAPDGEGQAITFNSLAEAKSFIEREREFWDFLLEKTKEAPNTSARQQARFPVDRMEYMRGILGQFEAGSVDREAVARDFNETFVRNNRKIPISYHPNAQAIAELAKILPPEALVMAAVYLNGRLHNAGEMQLNLRDENQLMGLVAAMNVRLGNSPSILQGAAAGLDQVRHTYAAMLNSERYKLQTEHAEWQRSRNDVETRANLLLEEKAKAADALGSKHGEAILRADAEFHKLEHTYNEKLRVAASTKYWGDKRGKHRRRAKQWGGLAALYAVAATAFMWWGVNEEYNAIVAMPANTSVAAFLALAARGLLVAVVLFWVGRIVVRMYLSELHLGMDAYERSTMVETYLALTNEGVISEKERALVLAPLFRPTADGLVKDDASADANLAALLGKISGK